MNGAETIDALGTWAEKGWADRESVERVQHLLERVADDEIDFVISRFNKTGMKVAWIEGGAIVQICAEPGPRGS